MPNRFVSKNGVLMQIHFNSYYIFNVIEGTALANRLSF